MLQLARLIHKVTKEISLRDAVSLDVVMAYNKRATGEKYLINPTRSG